MFCVPGFDFFNRQLKNSPYNYLEIGVFNGDSIAQLGREHPDHKIFGVDPFIEDGYTSGHTDVVQGQSANQQKINTAENIKGLQNVVLFEMMSSEFANTLSDTMIADMNVGWVLIDGSHHYPDVIQDAKLAMRMIGNRSGGIVFDDVNLPGVASAYREFLQQYQKQTGPAMDIYSTHTGHIIAHFINYE